MTAPVLTSMLDREAPDAKARFDHNKALANELREKVAEAALGGSEKHRERHVSRGKLLTVPLDNAVLYVQPLFVQADKSSVSELLGAQLSSVPELKQVVIVFGDRVLMRPTLKGAVAALFEDEGEGAASDQAVADTETPASPQPTRSN